jgi:hypothetical protein
MPRNLNEIVRSRIRLQEMEAKAKDPLFNGSRGRRGCGGSVILCMCDSETTFHCVNNRPKMGIQKVIRIEEKVVCEFYFKVRLEQEDLVSTVKYTLTPTQLHSPSKIPPPPSSFHQLKQTQRYWQFWVLQGRLVFSLFS